MARKQRSREQLIDEGDEEPARRRRPRWRYRFAFLILLVVGLAIAAPAIVGKTPLKDYLLSTALPPDVARLSVGDASLSWIGGQSLGGVILTDAAGQPILSAEGVTLQRSLLSLASNQRDLGRLVLTRPVIYVDTRAGGVTNIEELVSQLAEKSRQSAASATGGASGPTCVEVEIVDGTVLGRDQTTGQQWSIQQLSAVVKPSTAATGWEASGAGVASLAGAGAGNDPAGAAGRFKFQFAPTAGGGLTAELIADHLPLAPLEPLIATRIPGAKLAGFASADLRASSVPTADNRVVITATGRIDAAAVRFAAKSLAGDLVELDKVALAVDATVADGRLAARQLDLRGDWFQANLQGELDGAQLQQVSLAALPRRDATLTARVDLAKLSAMLPRTLGLRPGVRIDSGSLELTARSAEVNEKRRWTVAMAVENVVGADGQRPIRWTQPVEAGFDLVDFPAGPEVERMIFRTPFASATAEAEADGFAGKVEFNLGELGSELGQLVDLSAWQLAGAGEGKFMLRPGDGSAFTATAELDLADVDVRKNGKPVWVDPKLRIEATAAGARRGLTPTRLDAAKVGMRGEGDLLTAELLEPVSLEDPAAIWALTVGGAGPLDSWTGRLRPWVAGMPDQLAGQTKLSAKIRAGRGFVEASESQLSVDQLQMRSGTIRIAEPRVEAAGDFRWDGVASAIESRAFQLSSSSLSARSQNVSLRLAEGGPPTVRGDVAFRSDLARLAAWGLWGSDPNGLAPRGMTTGRLQLTSDGQGATATLAAAVEPFELVRPTAGPLGGAPLVAWSEPKLEIGGNVAYAAAADRLEMSNVRITGRTLQIGGAAIIDQLRGEGIVRGDVNVAYDANEMAKLLSAYLGPNVRLQGANQARLQASGRLKPSATPAMQVSSLQPSASSLPPHWSRVWQATSETGWSAADVFGLPIGPAKIVGNLREGQLAINPIDLQVGQGRIALQPRVIFDPAPAMLQLGPGQVASNITISPEVSDAILKYAAPIIAGATRAEGSFSAALDGFSAPLRQPKQGRAAGRLTIHRLSIVPGPMIADIVKLIGQVEAIGKGQPLGAVAPKQVAGVTMTEKTIDVQVVDGRVYHRNLEFMVDDVPVRSYGSVGFDETLALMIEVPIQQKWLGREKALQALAGQTIQIPVGGTFSKPQIDERAVANLSTQLLQGAAQGVIGNELNKALDKLFKPRQ